MEKDEIDTALGLKTPTMPGPKRATVFYHYLQSEEELPKHELANRADCSNQAVSKAFNALEEHGIVNKDHELTVVGEEVSKWFLQFIHGGYGVEQLKPFLQQLRDGDNSDLAEILDKLGKVEVTQQNENDRERPVRHYRKIIQSSDTIRELVPFRTPASDTFHTAVVDGELEAEFVVKESLMQETLENERTRQILEELRDSGAEYHVYKGDFPGYTITLPESDDLGLVALDDEMVFVQSTKPEIREWGETVYTQFKADSTPLDDYK